MKKSVALIGTLLMLVSVCSCKKRSYPKVAPSFSFEYYSEDSLGYQSTRLNLEYFIAGNTYDYCAYVRNKSESFAYVDDFHFEYDPEVFDVSPYYYKQEPKQDYKFLFAIDVKKESENNKIVVKHLNRTIAEINLPIRSYNERLDYFRYDYITKAPRDDVTREMFEKVTTISSKEEMEQYPTFISSVTASSVDEQFFETRAFAYILLNDQPNKYKYENYYIEDGTVYFRIAHYRSGKPNYDVLMARSKPWESSGTAIAVVIAKSDIENFSNFDFRINARVNN